MSKYNDIISKSLDELDVLINASGKTEDTQVLSKAKDDEDISPDDVSENAAPAVDDGTQSPGDIEQAEDDTDGAADTDEEDVTSDDLDEDDDEDTQKSLATELNGNENVKKALEVSEFLQDLVKGLDAVITDRTDSISKSVIQTSDESNELLAKSIVGIAKGQKAVLETNAEILKSFKAMNARMSTLEAKPAVRKSVAQANQVIEKSFEASSGDAPATKSSTLSKSEASAKLMAAYEGGNQSVMNDILALDGTGNLDSVSDAGRAVLGL